MKKGFILLFFLLIFIFTACSKTETTNNTTTNVQNTECTEARLQNNAGIFLYTEKDAMQQFGGSWKYLGIDQRTLKSGTKSIYGDKECVFDFKRDADSYGQPNYLSIQVAIPRLYNDMLDLDNLSNKMYSQGRDQINGENKGVVNPQIKIDNLGDEAILSASGFAMDGNTAGHHALFLKKGSNYFVIGCVKQPIKGDYNYSCSQEQFTVIAQKIISNL